MSQWQPIGNETQAIERCLLWCSDLAFGGEPEGTVMGRIYRYSDGSVVPRGTGHHGDWNYSHWMPLPPAPEVSHVG